MRVTPEIQAKNKFLINYVGFWAYVRNGRIELVDQSLGFLLYVAAVIGQCLVFDVNVTIKEKIDACIALRKELADIDKKIDEQFPEALGADSLRELMALNELYALREKICKFIERLDSQINESLGRVICV